jgi:ribosomal protein L28
MVGTYSNRTRATKFNPGGLQRRKPNLVWAKLSDGSRMRMCAKCLKKGKNALLREVKS